MAFPILSVRGVGLSGDSHRIPSSQPKRPPCFVLAMSVHTIALGKKSTTDRVSLAPSENVEGISHGDNSFSTADTPTGIGQRSTIWLEVFLPCTERSSVWSCPVIQPAGFLLPSLPKCTYRDVSRALSSPTIWGLAFPRYDTVLEPS